MTRSVYVTGIDRGDGRQVVELGVMELLTRHVDRVGVFRPLTHSDGPDRLFDLLRSRYRLTQSPDSVYGLSYEEAAALQAERGIDELVSRLVERFHAVAREYEFVLVLGSDFAGTNLPAELNLNARLANEFGAAVLAVVGGQGQEAESVRAEARNAYGAYHSMGCDVVAMIVNRIAPEHREAVVDRLAARLPVPCYALPEDGSLSAPTVGQIVHTLGAEVLLGDDSGLARDARDFVFGGAMLPTFLKALTPGALVVTPGTGRTWSSARSPRTAPEPRRSPVCCSPSTSGRDPTSWRWPPASRPAPRWSPCPAAPSRPRASCSRSRAS